MKYLILTIILGACGASNFQSSVKRTELFESYYCDHMDSVTKSEGRVVVNEGYVAIFIDSIAAPSVTWKIKSENVGTVSSLFKLEPVDSSRVGGSASLEINNKFMIYSYHVVYGNLFTGTGEHDKIMLKRSTE